MKRVSFCSAGGMFYYLANLVIWGGIFASLVVGCGVVEPPEPISTLPEDKYPTWSPDGRTIAFLHENPEASSEHEVTGLYILDLSSGERELLIEGFAGTPDWSPNGKLLVFSRGDLFTIQPDGRDLRRLTDDVSAFFPTWSPDGMRIAFDSPHMSSGGSNTIWLIRSDGSNLRNISEQDVGEWRDPDWSPTGRGIVHLRFVSGVFGEEVYIMDDTGINEQRLTHNNHNDRDPAWSPDGIQIAWTAIRDKRTEIWLMQTDGSSQQRLTEGSMPAWSPDSEQLVFSRLNANGDCVVLWAIRRDGSGLRQLTF